MNEESPVVILTTAGSSDDATRIARDLVEGRFAACVNVVPGVRSVYRWQGEVVEEGELLLIVKTLRERIGDLRSRLLAIHPYDVPEFVVIDVADIDPAYGRWLIRESR